MPLESFVQGARGSAGGKKKILGVLYKAGEYAKNPDFLACAENGLGLKDWLKEQGHEYIVTDDKDGDNSGDSRICLNIFATSTGILCIFGIHAFELLLHPSVGLGTPACDCCAHCEVRFEPLEFHALTFLANALSLWRCVCSCIALAEAGKLLMLGKCETRRSKAKSSAQFDMRLHRLSEGKVGGNFLVIVG